MPPYLRHLLVVLAFLVVLISPTDAETGPNKIGMLLMHGKGGSPTKHVYELAAALEQQGFLVANLDMPWSKRRDYEVDVNAAEKEVEAALNLLRNKGAQKLFVAGHSLGGLFAFYVGSRHRVDGIIAIAPGGNVASPIIQEKLGDSVALARELIAEGKGNEKVRLSDFEGAKGLYPLITTPSSYLSWFDPTGAMNQTTAINNLNPAIPVLYIVPTNDYPALIRIKSDVLAALPKHHFTKIYEPNSNHLGAPTASIKEITEWATAVAHAQ